MTILIDSHCHLNLINIYEHNKIAKIIHNAKLNGVQHFLCPAVKLENFSTLLKISYNYSNVNISFGIHPMHCNAINNNILYPLLKSFSIHKNCIAIGETGLDFYKSNIKKIQLQQEESFRIHIQVAKSVQKPLIIHTRYASNNTLRIMQEEQAQNIGGVIHCFNENIYFAKMAIDMNFYISLSGLLTFKNSEHLRETVKYIPMDRILIETDSPYLTPVPYRGCINQPSYIKYIVYELCKIKKEDFDTIAEKTTENFFSCFKPKFK